MPCGKANKGAYQKLTNDQSRPGDEPGLEVSLVHLTRYVNI